MSDFKFTVSYIALLNFSRSSPSILASSISQSRISLNWYFKPCSIDLCRSGRSPSQMQNGFMSKGFNAKCFSYQVFRSYKLDSESFISWVFDAKTFGIYVLKSCAIGSWIVDSEWMGLTNRTIEKLIKLNSKRITINFRQPSKRE